MHWSVRLAARAEADIADIAAWTIDQFGPRQADAYISLLLGGVRQLDAGPEVLGSHSLAHVAPRLRCLRVPRTRHLLMFRADHRARQIDILRILHDAMDPARHLGPAS